mmetsp:Transcript_10407/g.15883  ORF Transcript_10407/g.15883 Transcript_10407/m.15883 type:complete len:99 (+) Transcript_10407:495-791(+)
MDRWIDGYGARYYLELDTMQKQDGGRRDIYIYIYIYNGLLQYIKNTYTHTDTQIDGVVTMERIDTTRWDETRHVEIRHTIDTKPKNEGTNGRDGYIIL